MNEWMNELMNEWMNEWMSLRWYIYIKKRKKNKFVVILYYLLTKPDRVIALEGDLQEHVVASGQRPCFDSVLTKKKFFFCFFFENTVSVYVFCLVLGFFCIWSFSPQQSGGRLEWTRTKIDWATRWTVLWSSCRRCRTRTILFLAPRRARRHFLCGGDWKK